MGDCATRIEWVDKSGTRCLKFTFTGKLTEAAAIAAVEQWHAEFATCGEDKVVLVWDCLCMTGYERGARRAWTGALKKVQSQIETIWLITDSTIISMGAAVMTMLTPMTIKTVKAESGIVV